MKVLQINAVYEKFSTGRLVKELHETLLQNSVESYVACPDLCGLQDNAFQIGNPMDWKIHALLSRITGKQGYFSWNATKKLLAYMDIIQPDIVHLHNLHNNYLNLPMLFHYLKNRKIAVVVTLHDCWCFTGKCMYYIEYGCSRWRNHCGKCPAQKAGNKSWYFDFSKKLRADKEKWFSWIDSLAVIGVSKWVTEDAAQSVIKDADIIQCIYNWIDLEGFRPRECSEFREVLGLKNQFVVLGIAMSWIPLKGIDIFHTLADLLPENCHIVLIGDDTVIEQKHPKIQYVGTIHNADLLAQYYAIADVFVNPTVQETFGMTTAEAMACGTPIIAYNGTATPELVGRDESCGFLVDKNDAESYYKKILEIQKRDTKSLGEAARKRAEKMFSKERNIQQYLDIYQKLLKNKS